MTDAQKIERIKQMMDSRADGWAILGAIDELLKEPSEVTDEKPATDVVDQKEIMIAAQTLALTIPAQSFDQGFTWLVHRGDAEKIAVQLATLYFVKGYELAAIRKGK